MHTEKQDRGIVADEVLDRLASELKIPLDRSKNAKLAAHLGVPLHAIKNWRSRQTIADLDVIVLFCGEHGIDLNQVLLGKPFSAAQPGTTTFEILPITTPLDPVYDIDVDQFASEVAEFVKHRLRRTKDDMNSDPV